MTSQKSALIRQRVGASEGAEVAHAAAQLLKLSDGVIKQEFSRIPGAQGLDLNDFSSLFARGIQWVSEQYPTVTGPRMAVFAHEGTKVTIDDVTHPVHGICLARPVSGRGECDIIIPFEDVVRMLTALKAKTSYMFEAASRKEKIGVLNAREGIFLAGVEEAFHAVQHHDPILRSKYSNVSAFSSADKYDTDPRELDVIPVMQRALADYRSRGMGRGHD